MSDETLHARQTRFGRRRGWEMHHFMFGTRHFWRITGNGWCRPATKEEVQMWRLLKNAIPGDFKVWK